MNRYKFEEIAVNSTKKKKPTAADKDIYLGLEHLDSGTLKVSKFGSDFAPIGEKLIMKKGDVLFGKRRAYQKKVAIAPFDGIFSAHGMVLRPNPSVIDPDFFPLFISSDYFLDAAIRISVGSLSPTINWRDLKELEFDLPDMEKQRGLAKLLWAMQETIESYKELLSKTDELVVARLRQTLAGKEKFVPLKYYCDNGIENVRNKINKEDRILYIEISSIDNALNRIVQPTEILFGDAPASAKQILKYGDVLVSLVRPNLKKVAMNHFTYDNVIGTSGFCVLRPNDKSTSEFLKAVALSDEFTSKMVSSVTGSTYPTIKNIDVLDYVLPLLSKKEILNFSLFAERANDAKNSLEQALREIKESYMKMTKKF